MKKKIKAGFIVLHYKAVNETIECVNSILALNRSNEIQIIIIDNASQDGSSEILNLRYGNVENIKIIVSKDNLGFAKGNNLGYEYLCMNFKMNFCVAANNDIIFNQVDFIDKIDKIYKEKQFYVLGPDVINTYTKEHQSPLSLKFRDLKATELQIEIIKREMKYIRCYRIKKIIYNSEFIRIIKKVKRKIKPSITSKEMENVLLIGACLIFSTEFIEKKKELFNPVTFLYYEEDFLFHECEKNKWLVLYHPEIKVNHQHSASTRYMGKNYYNIRQFSLRCCLESAELYRQMLIKEKKDKEHHEN